MICFRKHIVAGIIFIIIISLGILRADAKTTLRMNHQFPADTTGSKLDQKFADEVKKATNGEVEIKIFWSNALGEPKENLQMLKLGVIDMAAMSAGYFPQELPFHSAPNSIPMGMDDICQSSAIMNSFINDIPAFAAEAKQNQIRPLFFHLLNPYLLVSKKSVSSFSELKGLRIRTWGEDMPRLVKAAGATPVSLFLPDIYEALKNNVIDACPFSVDLTKNYKIYEQAKHISNVVMWEGPSWGVWISEKSLGKLTPAQQNIISEIVSDIRNEELTLTVESEKSSIAFLKENGVSFHPFPSEELDKWKQASPDFFSDWIIKMDKIGKSDDARQTVQKWKEMRNSIRCSE